ncbi:EamA family transporter [Oceanispirochaeta crateris]|uniref:EamA family transporter n=1 Tax=Oceanispirochaeta crateris TaxID=2518645 RepID=A0A5C1QNE8_9SPIO|nr:EamA family transporter [Oceanispirochaeta crateris]QEN08868.1 EamA family transporter [Oceanispirochaeta crateris]
MDKKNWLLLLLLSILWGGSYFFVAIALTGLPIFTIVFLRVFNGAALLVLFIFLTGRKLPGNGRTWLTLFIMGFFNNAIPFTMIVSGQQYVSSGFASILIAITPFLTVITAHLLTKDEKISSGKIVGIFLGILGVFILIGFESMQWGSKELLGSIFVLTATVSYSIASVWGKKFKSLNMDPVATAAGQLICSSLILLPLMLISDKPWQLPLPNIEVWGAIAGIALFSTAVAYIVYFQILRNSGATNVMLVTFLIPIIAVIMGVIFLSENFKIQYLYGMIMIGLGLVAIDGRLFQKIKGDNQVGS